MWIASHFIIKTSWNYFQNCASDKEIPGQSEAKSVEGGFENQAFTADAPKDFSDTIFKIVD